VTDPWLAELLFALIEHSIAYVSSVSPERSLPVSEEGFSGLHALSGHLWRRPEELGS
jgi:hypothetical protein